MLVACSLGNDGPVAPLQWQFDKEMIVPMFQVSSNFPSSPLCPDAIQGRNFHEFRADDPLRPGDHTLADGKGRRETDCD